VVIVLVVTTLDGIVLSGLRGAGVVSDRTEVIIVPSVLVETVRRARSCQSRHIWPRSTSPIPPRGRDGGEVVRLSYIMRLRQEEGSWPTLA
jgi:hypothetical protein